MKKNQKHPKHEQKESMSQTALQRLCPSLERCRAALNLDVMVIEERENFEVACILQGYKSVQVTSTEIFNKTDTGLLKLFERENIRILPFAEYTLSELQQVDVKVAMVPTHKREERVVIFAPEGKRAAYFFVAWQLEINQAEYDRPGSRYESHNPYLTGALLSYAQVDRLFFYQIAAFGHMAKKSGLKVPDQHFAAWPETLQDQFKHFAEHNWKQTAIYDLWQRDREEAEEWLKKWQGVSTDELKRHCHEEQERIEQLYQTLLVPEKSARQHNHPEH